MPTTADQMTPAQLARSTDRVAATVRAERDAAEVRAEAALLAYYLAPEDGALADACTAASTVVHDLRAALVSYVVHGLAPATCLRTGAGPATSLHIACDAAAEEARERLTRALATEAP